MCNQRRGCSGGLFGEKQLEKARGHVIAVIRFDT